MTARLAAVALLLASVACSPQPPPVDESDASGPVSAARNDRATTTVPASSDDPGSDGGALGRRSVYSSLKDCPVIRAEREEMPFSEVECRTPGPFAIRIAEADLRETMTLVGADGRATQLATARIGGGAFSAFGDTAEWRGNDRPAAAGAFEPDALIVRYSFAAEPYPAPERSVLLAVRLGREPCIVAAIVPGPQQNERARRAADAPGPCLPEG